MSQLQQAINVASLALHGKTDKAGQPLINHCLRVMGKLTPEVHKVVGVLHEVIEDGGMSVTQVEHQFGSAVARAVDALSRRPGERYLQDYIPRLKTEPLAVPAKLADIDDHLEHASELSEADKGLLVRYKRAKALLEG